MTKEKIMISVSKEDLDVINRAAETERRSRSSLMVKASLDYTKRIAEN